MTSTNVDTIFAERMRELRGDRSLDDVAQQIGLNRATLGYYETGKRHPDAEILKRIADFYGVSLDYLVGISETKTRDIDIQSIAEKTGLSEKAVEKLIKINQGHEKSREERLKALCWLIREPYLLYLIADYFNLNFKSENYTVTIETEDETVLHRKLKKNELLYMNGFQINNWWNLEEIIFQGIKSALERIRMEFYRD